MTDEVFTKIVDALVPYDYKGRFSLFHINEPLLDTRLEEKIQYTRKRSSIIKTG